MRLILPVFLLLAAATAEAGAWLREKGTGFLAFKGVAAQDGATDGAIYFEYGVRPDLTLGARAGADLTLSQVDMQAKGYMIDGTAFAFLRRPIHLSNRPFKLAYELGIGSTYGPDTDPLVLTGLSYGRGLKLGERYGWLAIDAAVEWSLGKTSDLAKLDATLGLTLNDRFKVMGQVFLSETDSVQTTTLSTSLIWQPKPDRPSYVVGVERQDGQMGLAFGAWYDF